MDARYLDLEGVVEELFPKKRSRGDLTTNPVTGSEFCWGIDPIAVQKKNAVLALRAGEWISRTGPFGAPTLPLSWAERDAMRFKKADPLSHLIAAFANSLRVHNWDYENHPSFEEFARSVLASKHTPEFVRTNEALRKKYPPKQLCAIGPGICWSPNRRK
jgi:hypothetical protein